jgi:hypothetical protein
MEKPFTADVCALIAELDALRWHRGEIGLAAVPEESRPPRLCGVQEFLTPTVYR